MQFLFDICLRTHKSIQEVDEVGRSFKSCLGYARQIEIHVVPGILHDY